MKTDELVAWAMMGIGVIGFLVSFPLWLSGRIDDRTMLGVTLVLSWAALWYAAFIAIIDTRKTRRDSPAAVLKSMLERTEDAVS